MKSLFPRPRPSEPCLFSSSGPDPLKSLVLASPAPPVGCASSAVFRRLGCVIVHQRFSPPRPPHLLGCFARCPASRCTERLIGAAWAFSLLASERRRRRRRRRLVCFAVLPRLDKTWRRCLIFLPRARVAASCHPLYCTVSLSYCIVSPRRSAIDSRAFVARAPHMALAFCTWIASPSG